MLHTRTVIAACVGFLTGVGIASIAFAYVIVPWIPIAVVCSAAALAAAIGMRGAHRRFAVVAMSALVFGIVRFAIAVPVPAGADADTVEGRVVRVVPAGDGRMRVAVRDAAYDAPIVVSLTRSDVRYGDVIRVSCAPRQPRYLRDRLTAAGECWVGAYVTPQLLARGGGSPTLRALGALRERFAATNAAHLTGNARAVTASIALGDRTATTGALLEAFRTTGTVHALVVSGGHMSIIGMLLLGALRHIPVHRRTALLATVAILAAFVVMVGADPSAVRGALMAAALIAVELCGRIASRVRILLLVAVVMVAVHPYVLAYDLGFQLSFAAVAGIVLLTTVFERALPGRHAWGREVRAAIAASAAATIATAPLLIGVFGTFSIIGVLANVPVLLLLTPLLVAAFAFLGLGTLLPPLAPLLAWPAGAFAHSVAWIVQRAAAIPWAQAHFAPWDWWFIIGCYAFLGACVIGSMRARGERILSPFRVLSADAALLSGAPVQCEEQRMRS
ncbi:MAG: ComEC/Rec2 family competence protein [bacterium]|nr:ComEC/Rec2 family competence protein [bacterium]